MKRVKYPRTPHMPNSPGATSDDVKLKSLAHFMRKKCVFSEKLDGENTTLYRDHIHARSVDGRHHPSRSWVKQLHSSIAHMIPKGWRVCGENMYAKHSIYYDNLPSYFFVFSVWNDKDFCLGWNEMIEWCNLVGLETVPSQEFYFSESSQLECNGTSAFDIWTDENKVEPTVREGVVIRTRNGFAFDDFQSHIAKYVRANHVQTDEHWMHSTVIPNGLAT